MTQIAFRTLASGGIQARGEAEAEAIRAKGMAEAEAMEKKADADPLILFPNLILTY